MFLITTKSPADNPCAVEVIVIVVPERDQLNPAYKVPVDNSWAASSPLVTKYLTALLYTVEIPPPPPPEIVT